MYGNADDLLAAGEFARAGRRYERENRWEEAIHAYSRAGRFDEAARLLETLGRPGDAGWMLLRELPRRATRTMRLTQAAKRAAVRAALNFARAGARDMACGLLINVGEGARAAGLLRMAGRRDDAVLAMQGRSLPKSPWPDGLLFALDPRTGRGFGEEATPPTEPEAGKKSTVGDTVDFSSPSSEVDSGAFSIEIDDVISEFDIVDLGASDSDIRAAPVVALRSDDAVLDSLLEQSGSAFSAGFEPNFDSDPVDGGGLESTGDALSFGSEHLPFGDDLPFGDTPLPYGDSSFGFGLDSFSSAEQGAALPALGELPESESALGLAFPGLAPETLRSDDFGPMSVGPGTTLADRYEIEEQIGSGATARVFAARDTELDEVVALKLFVHSVGSDEAAMRRFRREVRLSRDLIHPNVVRIFEFGVRHGLRFITMELLEGEDLKAYTARRGGKLKPREATRLMLQATAGLKAAHEVGVIHRDIKPTNLMILEDGGHLKLMDFGLAKVNTEQTISDLGARVGTPRYMSPEQMRGKSEIGPASDLYSLGVVFYEILTGERTVDVEGGLVSVLKASLGEMPPPPIERNSKIPRDLSDLVMRLLAKDPADRYPTAEKLRRALRGSSALKRGRR